MIAQQIKTVIYAAVHARVRKKLSPLSATQRESLDLIATKIARILSGDPNHEDHWLDIEGYARIACMEQSK